jgi:hypothetical protein
MDGAVPEKGVPVAEEPEVRLSINGSGAGLLAGDRCMS